MMKPFIARLGVPAWLIVLAIAIIVAVPRFYWMLRGDYNTIVIIFIFFAVLPFILLSREGRRKIGLVKPLSWWRVLTACMMGGALSYCIYLLGVVLYDGSLLNWYVTIQQTFQQRGDIVKAVRASPGLFWAFAVPAMIFSPIGEEFFFRGIFHEAFAERFSPTTALVVEASLFGLMHIAHYGLVWQGNNITFMFPSVVWWVGLMTLTAALFAFTRLYAASLWASVACHAGFNLVMMWCIFFRL